jgi:WD40 repeat protein
MRELQLYVPRRRDATTFVHQLQFVADGSALVGWVDEDRLGHGGEGPYGTVLLRCSLATGTSTRLELPYFFGDDARGPFAGPMLSPDGRFLVTEVHVNDYDEANTIFLGDAFSQSEELPYIHTQPIEFAGLFFTPDSAALVAVWNDPDGFGSGIGRYDLSRFTGSPGGWRKKRVPPSTAMAREWRWGKYIARPKWKTLLTKPGWGRAVAATLSADGNLLAVLDEPGHLHVANLKTKRVTATLAHDGRAPLDTSATRIAFDPSAQWIVQLAAGRLFARPLGAGEAWETKAALGYAQDFAFHPDGRVLCAVFRDGQAHDLDPLTGTVRQSFKWAKKPKPLYSVAFAPDGLTCAAGGENGKVVIWDVDA